MLRSSLKGISRKALAEIGLTPSIPFKLQGCDPEHKWGIRTKFQLSASLPLPVRGKIVQWAPFFQRAISREGLEVWRWTKTRWEALRIAFPYVSSDYADCSRKLEKNARVHHQTGFSPTWNDRSTSRFRQNKVQCEVEDSYKFREYWWTARLLFPY